MKTKTFFKTTIISITAYAVAFVFAVPYLHMLTTATKPDDELFMMPATYLPSDWQWVNFIQTFENAPIGIYLRNSIIISLLATLVVLVVALPAAYYVARFKFRGKAIFLLLVLVTQMLSPVALVVGIYREVVTLGLVNTYLSLVLVSAAFNLAFAIWIMAGFFASIPSEIEDAAFIDGCSRFMAMRKITIPLALPGIATALIFTFIAAWNEFVIALTLTSTVDRRPLTVGINTFIGQYQVQWNYLFAAAFISIIPVVILFGSIQKWLVSGLTAGSIK
ncbi:MAG: carbohydrate ABC transporter permease [Candidatus Nanopelagicales bacterium]